MGYSIMKIHGISLISAHIIQLNDKPANPVFKRMREREREGEADNI
jgi:hypothetical protein